MMVGLLAAALSSFNSAINSMTSSLVSDIYLPLKKKYGKKTQQKEESLKESRILVVFMGIVLTAFAVIAAIMQGAGGQSLVDFALGVMSFSYAGMLGVFLCAVLTKRGNVKSVIAALIVGFLIVLILQPYILGNWTEATMGTPIAIAWPWWTLIGGSISFGICSLGKQTLKK
jgi:Na+/proline symporter